MSKRPEQLQVPGTEPVEPHPDVRVALDAWLAARDDAKDARAAVVNAHDVLLDKIQDAKIPYYTYDDDGKRRRVFPSATPKLKTSTVSTPQASGRRGRERDVTMPIDKERAKAVDALPDHVVALANGLEKAFPGATVTVSKGDERVEHRKVRRSDAVDDGDPFANVRGLLDDAAAKQDAT